VSWLAKVKRRKGGVYLWRVDHHLNRARRVNGYVGETVSFYFRSRQHMGSSHYADGTARRAGVAVKVASQPWSDLNPKMYRVIKLPWWLCWKWVLRPLETLMILCMWPVYNDSKNRWNPRRIDRGRARVERARRDSGAGPGRVKVIGYHAVRGIVQVVLGFLFLAGVYLWVTHR
jgi:hypothetical protein